MSDSSPPVAPRISLRFGVNVGWLSRGEASPARAAADAEAAGFDVVTAADHVGSTSPFVVLGVAAAVTTRVRLRTYVLDHGFWNPGLLARDVATLDAVSGGRVELGLGAGHMRHEHDAVGLPFAGHADRLAALGEFVAEVRRHLAGDAGVAPSPAPVQAPGPVQAPVPVLIGAMSRPGLEVAVRHAEIVALSGLLSFPGGATRALRVCSSAEFDERVGWVAELRRATGRPAEPLDVLVQHVSLDRDPQEAASELAAEFDGQVSAGALLDSPALLFARTEAEAAAELLRRSERWGIGSWCVHQPSLVAMARVIKAVRS